MRRRVCMCTFNLPPSPRPLSLSFSRVTTKSIREQAGKHKIFLSSLLTGGSWFRSASITSEGEFSDRLKRLPCANVFSVSAEVQARAREGEYVFETLLSFLYARSLADTRLCHATQLASYPPTLYSSFPLVYPRVHSFLPLPNKFFNYLRTSYLSTAVGKHANLHYTLFPRSGEPQSDISMVFFRYSIGKKL